MDNEMPREAGPEISIVLIASDLLSPLLRIIVTLSRGGLRPCCCATGPGMRWWALKSVMRTRTRPLAGASSC